MIWLKRLAPFVLLLAVWFGYRWITHSQMNKFLAETKEQARVTAELWVASAMFHAEPTKYVKFRDSLLTAHHLDKSTMLSFATKAESNPDWAQAYSNYVHIYVDSLYKIEDSTRKANHPKSAAPLPPPPKRGLDSARAMIQNFLEDSAGARRPAPRADSIAPKR